jgi:hypothetical protein
VGQEALIAHIGGFHERVPGARVASITGWQMPGPGATVTLEGMDFGELGDDGRLKRIVGFFGPFPAG